MIITILSVSKQSAVTKTGKAYSQLEVAYKNADGKVMGKKLMPFGDSRAIFDVLAGAQAGDTYDITSEKQGDFWNWTAASKSDGTAPSTPAAHKPAGKVTGSNYETSEERARRQVMIVRQSSLSTAVALIACHKETKSVSKASEVISIAKEFEQYVLNTGEVPVAETIKLESEVL